MPLNESERRVIRTALAVTADRREWCELMRCLMPTLVKDQDLLFEILRARMGMIVPNAGPQVHPYEEAIRLLWDVGLRFQFDDMRCFPSTKNIR